MTRRYDQQRRAASAAGTRERIVDATVELHGEQGIMATSFRDVAERADVGVGTVYHHFPTLEELVTACGGRLRETTAPPQTDVFVGVRSGPARLERLVSEVFAWYERYPSWRRGLNDADKLAVLAEAVAAREAHLRSLVEAALGDGADPTQVDAVRAVVDFEVYRCLVDGGRSTAQAASVVTRLLHGGIRSLTG